jgi:hypothetical protein
MREVVMLAAGQDPITWQSLTTVAGASGAAIALVQFVKIFWSTMADKTARMISAALGLITVEVAIIATGSARVSTLLLGILVGVEAGLAASKAFEVAKHGINSTVATKE